MNALVPLAGLTVAAVAAAAVLRPFRRGGVPALERLADPLEDQRTALLSSLRELDAERAAGIIGGSDHRALRAETEARAVAVLRELEARDGHGRLSTDLRHIRPVAPSTRERRSAALPALLVGAALLAVSVPLLAGAIRGRAPGQAFTGAAVGAAQPLFALERRAAEHPNDVAARLDLGARYLDIGRGDDALVQYRAAVALDPRNAEANAELALLEFGRGDVAAAMGNVRTALTTDPAFPEALYAKGVILLEGMHRPANAAAAFHAYLEAAPYGAHVDEVRALLAQIASS